MNEKRTHSEKNKSKQLLCLKCGQFSEDGTTCIRCLESIQLVDNMMDAEKLRKGLNVILNNFGSDVAAAFRKDPAASSVMEVLHYPGIQAILLHRIAHFFWTLKLPYIPRYLNFLSLQTTGVDIHPGANIGKEFLLIMELEL